MDLRASMALAGESLLNSLCPSNHNLCTFTVIADREYRVFLKYNAACHNLCRWWDAMMRLEDTTGFSIPPDIEAIMLQHLLDFFNNTDDLCFTPSKLADVEPTFLVHSFRENALALSSLYHVRGNQWALAKAQRMLETLDRILRPDCTWDFEKLDFYHRCVEFYGKEKIDYYEYRGRRGYIGDPDVGVDGRLIEGLVWCYRMTHLPLALELADRLSRFHVVHTMHPDGSLNAEIHPEHTHSYLNTLKGIVGFAALTGQKEYLDIVAATFRRTVRERVVKESGFASHDFMQDGLSETASPADAAQIALWLGMNGYPEFFDDAERLVRSRVIPSQITDCPDLKPLPEVPQEDCTNLKERFIGGYGCGIIRPNTADNVYTDVTASVLHAVTDVYRNIAARTDAGLTVCLHFDLEDENVSIVSERQQAARLSVTPKVHDNVLIRIPRWTPAESVKVSVNGQSVPIRKIGGFAFVPKGLLPGKILLEYALPERATVEHTIGIDFTFTWRGDQIVGVSPNDDFFPFYPSGPNCASYEEQEDHKQEREEAKRQHEL